MGSFLTSVKDEQKQLIVKIQKISEPLEKIKQYYGLFKSVCDSFLILKNQFIQIFQESANQKLEIFDRQSTGKIDGLQIFCGLIAFATNCTFKAKLKFFFSIFDFNQIKKISFVDLQYMILCICNSTYKILNKNAKANQSQIVQWLKKYLSQKQRIHITKLYNFCMKSIQVKTFFSLVKSSGSGSGIDQKCTSNHELIKNIGKKILYNYEQIQKTQTKREVQDKYQWHRNLAQKITNPYKASHSHNYSSQLAWVYGIKTEPIANPFIIIQNQILYTTSTLMILYNIDTNKQKFYKNHKHQISCFTISQQKSLVISSDEGVYPKIHIWNYKTLENKTIIETYHPKGILLMHVIQSPSSRLSQQLLITVGFFKKTNIVIYSLNEDISKNILNQILYSFCLTEMVINLTPIFTYLDQGESIMNVKCCFIGFTQKSFYIVELLPNTDIGSVSTTAITVDQKQKYKQSASQIISQYIYKQASQITTGIAIYISVDNPLLKCFFNEETLNVCIITGHQNGIVKIVFWNNEGIFSEQILIQPLSETENMRSQPISHIDYTQEFFFIGCGNTITVYNWHYIHSRDNQCRIITIDQNPQLKLFSSQIQFFNMNKNEQFVIIMTKQGDFIKVSNREIVYEQMNFLEIEKMNKITTMIKLEGSSKSMCLLQKNQDQYLIYVVNQMKKILIINPLSHQIQNVWEISADDQITVINAVYTDQDILYFVCGCKSGKLYIRIGLEENPKFYDCSSEILQVKISRDASYLVVTTIQKYLFFFTHINKNFTSPRKLHFQNQIPICVNFLDNNKYFLVNTSAKNIYLVEMPQLKHKNIHKQSENINISKMEISYPNVLQQTQKKIMYSKSFLGGQLKYYIIALCTGQIRYFQNSTNLQNFSFVSLFTHQSHLSSLCIVNDQQTFYSLGKYDNSLIEWSVQRIPSIQNIPNSIKVQNKKNQTENHIEFLKIQQLSKYHELLNSSKPQDLYIFLGTKIQKLNLSLSSCLRGQSQAMTINVSGSQNKQEQEDIINVEEKFQEGLDMNKQKQMKQQKQQKQSKLPKVMSMSMNQNQNDRKLELRQPNLSLQICSIFGAQSYKKDSVKYLLSSGLQTYTQNLSKRVSAQTTSQNSNNCIIHYSSKYIIKTNLQTKHQQILQDAKYKISCFTIAYNQKILQKNNVRSTKQTKNYTLFFSICEQKPSIYINGCYNKLETTHEQGIIHLCTYKNMLLSYGLLEKQKSYSINLHNFVTKELLFVRTTHIQISQLLLLNQTTFLSLNQIRIWKDFYPSQKIGYATAACVMSQLKQGRLQYNLNTDDQFSSNFQHLHSNLQQNNANDMPIPDVCLGTDSGNISMMVHGGIYTIINKAHEGDITSIQLIKSSKDWLKSKFKQQRLQRQGKSKNDQRSNFAHSQNFGYSQFQLITVGKDSKIKIWNQIFQCKLMINFQDEILSKMTYLIDNQNSQSGSNYARKFKKKKYQNYQNQHDLQKQMQIQMGIQQKNSYKASSNLQEQDGIGNDNINQNSQKYRRNNNSNKYNAHLNHVKIKGIDCIVSYGVQKSQNQQHQSGYSQQASNHNTSQAVQRNAKDLQQMNKKILVNLSDGSIYEIKLTMVQKNKLQHKKFKDHNHEKGLNDNDSKELQDSSSFSEASQQQSGYDINGSSNQNSDNNSSSILPNRYNDNDQVKENYLKQHRNSDILLHRTSNQSNYEYQKQITKVLEAHSSDIGLTTNSTNSTNTNATECNHKSKIVKHKNRSNNNKNGPSSSSSQDLQKIVIFERFLLFTLHPQLPIIASIGNDNKLLFRQYETFEILGSFITENQTSSVGNMNNMNNMNNINNMNNTNNDTQNGYYSRNRIRCLKFSKKGHLIALGFQNGEIKLFTVITKLKDDKIVSLDLLFSQKFKRKQNSPPAQVLNIQFSQKSTYFSASFLPQHQQKKQAKKQSDSLTSRQNSYVQIYKLKQQHAQTIQQIYYNFYDKIQIKNQDKFSPKYQKCVHTMTFTTTTNGQSALVLYEQYVNIFKIRVNYTIKSKYSIYVIQQKHFLKKQFSIDWTKIPFHNSVNFYKISNFQNNIQNIPNIQNGLKPSQNNDKNRNNISKTEQNQLMISSMCFYKNFLIYGGTHGKIHLVKNSSLVTSKPIEDYHQIQMALSKTYSSQISFINQIQISAATLLPQNSIKNKQKFVYLFVSGVLDESIVMYKLIEQQNKNDLDYQNYMIDIKDPNQVYPTQNKFFDFVNNIQPLRQQIQQLLLDVQNFQSSPQQKEDIGLQIQKVLGRRAYDRRNNVFTDKNNLIYTIGPNLVIYEPESRLQRILPSDPNQYSYSPQISTLFYGKKDNLLVLTTQEEKCRIFVWDIRAQICLSQMQVDCSIIYNIRLSQSHKGIAVFYGINELYQLTLCVVDWKNKKIIAKTTMIHTAVWKIKDLNLLEQPYTNSNTKTNGKINTQINSKSSSYRNSKSFSAFTQFSQQISFLTCGAQHLSLWKVKCENLIQTHFINMPARVTFMVVKQLNQNIILAACDKGCIYFWKNYQCVKQIKVHTGIIRSMEIINVDVQVQVQAQVLPSQEISKDKNLQSKQVKIKSTLNQFSFDDTYLLTGGLDSQIIISKIVARGDQLQILSSKSVNPRLSTSTSINPKLQQQSVYLTEYDVQSLCIKSIELKRASEVNLNSQTYEDHQQQFQHQHQHQHERQKQKQRSYNSHHQIKGNSNHLNVNANQSQNHQNLSNEEAKNPASLYRLQKLGKLAKLEIQIYVGTRSGDVYQTTIQIYKQPQNQPHNVSSILYHSLVQFTPMNQILYGQDHQTIVSLVFNNSPIDEFLYTLTITGKLDIWNLTNMSFTKIFSYKFMKKAKKIFLYKEDLIICFEKQIIFVQLQISTKSISQKKIRIKQQKTLLFDGTISQCCFSQAQKYLAVALHKNQSNQILIYQIQKKIPIYQSPILKYEIQYLDFSTDQKYILFKDKFQQIGMIYLVTLKRINTIFVQMKIQWQSEGLRISPKAQPIYNSYNCENKITTICRLNENYIIAGDQMGTLRIFTYPIQDDRLGQLHTHCYTKHMNNINNIKQHKNLSYVATTSVYDRSLIIWRKTTQNEIQ